MTLTFAELKEKLAELYDPDDIVDALEITTEELLDAFEEKLSAKLYKFSEELNNDDD